MAFIWTVVVDPSEPFVVAHCFDTRDPSNTRNGKGPNVADAIEDAMGHPMQRWHEVMGGEPWYTRRERDDPEVLWDYTGDPGPIEVVRDSG